MFGRISVDVCVVVWRVALVCPAARRIGPVDSLSLGRLCRVVFNFTALLPYGCKCDTLLCCVVHFVLKVAETVLFGSTCTVKPYLTYPHECESRGN